MPGRFAPERLAQETLEGGDGAPHLGAVLAHDDERESLGCADPWDCIHGRHIGRHEKLELAIPPGSAAL